MGETLSDRYERLVADVRAAPSLCLEVLRILTFILRAQEADFAERRIRQNAINERLFESDLEDEAIPYRDTDAFDADWGGGVFMSVSALQEKMDDYANTQCTKVPEVAALAERVGQALTPVQLFELLQKHEFELEAAAAEAVSAANKAAARAAAFDRNADVQQAIKDAEALIAEDRFPDSHTIRAFGEDVQAGVRFGALVLSNERFVGHISEIEKQDDPEAGPKAIAAASDALVEVRSLAMTLSVAASS